MSAIYLGRKIFSVSDSGRRLKSQAALRKVCHNSRVCTALTSVQPVVAWGSVPPGSSVHVVPPPRRATLPLSWLFIFICSSLLYAQGRVNTIKQHTSKYAIKKLSKKKRQTTKHTQHENYLMTVFRKQSQIICPTPWCLWCTWRCDITVRHPRCYITRLRVGTLLGRRQKWRTKWHTIRLIFTVFFISVSQTAPPARCRRGWMPPKLSPFPPALCAARTSPQLIVSQSKTVCNPCLWVT